MEDKKQIIGMTKSHLNLKGSKARSMELDFLRILYFQKTFEHKFYKGYLLVMNEKIASTIRDSWCKKYKIRYPSNFLIVESFENILSENDYKKLEAQISEQVEKNQKGNQADSSSEDAVADKSSILEEMLKEYILKENSKFTLEQNKYISHDLDINWDVCLNIIPKPKYQKLQEQLESYISERCREFGVNHFFNYPLVEEIPNAGEGEPLYLSVSGMYGGFNLYSKIVNNEFTIVSSSWSRVIDYSEETVEITENGVK